MTDEQLGRLIWAIARAARYSVGESDRIRDEAMGVREPDDPSEREG